MEEDYDEFHRFIRDLRQQFDGNRIRWIKFCLFGMLPIDNLCKPEVHALELFYDLRDNGYIGPNNVNILLEIATLSGLKKAEDLVLQYIRDNNVENSDQEWISPQRKQMFKTLRNVGLDELKRVILHNDFERYEYTNIWDVVMRLETEEYPDVFDNLLQILHPTNEPQEISKDEEALGSKNQPDKNIPTDIAARELDFQKAYKEALNGGSVKVNLGMLKVIGQEGVGKTCLINACLGEEFEKDHDITDGIDVIRTASTTWTEAKTDSGNPSKQYTKMVTDKLRIDMKRPTDDDDYNNDENKDDKNDDNNDYKNDSADAATQAVPFDTDQQLDKDVIKKVEENKETLEKTFNIWDHGGQLIYHGLHRMFMTLQALYIVVFDLSKPLDDLATFIDSTGEMCKHHWTNLQFILSYILSVYSHSRIVEEDEENEVHKPTILIVGTHKGKLGETEEQQNVEAEKMFKKIQDVLKTKPYGKHVYQYFAIENNQPTTDKSFSDLKQVIDDLMKALEKEIPLKWMRFRCGLDDLRREKQPSFSLCSLEELKMLASNNGIDKKTKSVLLIYLHDHGEIVYMPDNELLSNKAVLDPMRLVEIVTTFVTVVPSKKHFGMFNESFDKLDKGILEEKLLRKLWRDSKVDKRKNFKFLVALMIQLGFICERKTTSSQDRANTSTGSVVERSFYVPLRLAFKTASDKVSAVPDKFPAISIYYDFEGYLPDVLFPYMIIDFLNKFQKKGVDPILSCNYAELYFDQYHVVTLSLVKVVTNEDERKFLLKVTIKRTPTLKETSTKEPSSEACKEVLLTIQKSFEPTKDGGRRGIQFERCILCECSKKSKKKHIQNLEDFQYEKLTCTKTGRSVTMDVKRYKRLFGVNTDVAGTSSSNQGVPSGTDTASGAGADSAEATLQGNSVIINLLPSPEGIHATSSSDQRRSRLTKKEICKECIILTFCLLLVIVMAIWIHKYEEIAEIVSSIVLAVTLVGYGYHIFRKIRSYYRRQR